MKIRESLDNLIYRFFVGHFLSFPLEKLREILTFPMKIRES